jgi:plastocyanin
MKHRFLVLSACMLTGVVAACGSPQATHETATSTPVDGPVSGKITISNFTFTSPQSVAPGSTVGIINSDSAEHSVTADQGGAFNVDVDGNGTATLIAPTAPGTYAYHCTYHPMMHAQLVVR